MDSTGSSLPPFRGGEWFTAQHRGDGWEKGGHLVYMGAITVTLGRLLLIRNSTEWGWALFRPWQQLCKMWWMLRIQGQSLLLWKLKWDVLINRICRCVMQPFLNLILPLLFSWRNLTTFWNFTVLAGRVNSYENYQPSINALLVILRRNVPVWWQQWCQRRSCWFISAI